MVRFKDTLGHEFEITKEQADGKEPIDCPVCGWRGTPLDGGTAVLASTYTGNTTEAGSKYLQENEQA